MAIRLGNCSICGSSGPITEGHVGVAKSNGGSNTEPQCYGCNGSINNAFQKNFSTLFKIGECGSVLNIGSETYLLEAGSAWNSGTLTSFYFSNSAPSGCTQIQARDGMFQYPTILSSSNSFLFSGGKPGWIVYQIAKPMFISI